MCHKTDSRWISSALMFGTTEGGKYSHMERVAASAHGWCVSFADTPRKRDPRRQEKRPTPVREVSRPCDVSHMSAWKVCSHDRRLTTVPTCLIGMECAEAATAVWSGLNLLLVTQVFPLWASRIMKRGGSLL